MLYHRKVCAKNEVRLIVDGADSTRQSRIDSNVYQVSNPLFTLAAWYASL